MSLSSRWGPNDGLLHSVVHLAQQLSCLPCPSPPGNLGPSSLGLSQHSRPLPHPHLGTESSWGCCSSVSSGVGHGEHRSGPGQAGLGSRGRQKFQKFKDTNRGKSQAHSALAPRSDPACSGTTRPVLTYLSRNLAGACPLLLPRCKLQALTGPPPSKNPARKQSPISGAMITDGFLPSPYPTNLDADLLDILISLIPFESQWNMDRHTANKAKFLNKVNNSKV